MTTQTPLNKPYFALTHFESTQQCCLLYSQSQGPQPKQSAEVWPQSKARLNLQSCSRLTPQYVEALVIFTMCWPLIPARDSKVCTWCRFGTNVEVMQCKQDELFFFHSYKSLGEGLHSVWKWNLPAWSGRQMHCNGTVAYVSLAPVRDCLAILASHPSALGQKAPWRIQSHKYTAKHARVVTIKL